MHQSMSPSIRLLWLTSFFLAGSPLALAAQPDEKLDQLRKDYAGAREAAAKIERPKGSSPDFPDTLRIWSDAVRKKREATHLLVPALLQRWISLPDDSRQLPAIRHEIKTVYQEMAVQID